MPSSTPSCGIIIFGASGDLAKRKLIPALYELSREGLLADQSYVLGFSRSKMTDEQFRADLKEAVSKYSRTKFDEAVWKKLEPRLCYVSADYGSEADYGTVAQKLEHLDKQFGTDKNRLYYLSTPPNTFEPILTNVGKLKRKDEAAGGGKGTFERVIIEKPFGRDLATAKALNKTLHTYFAEDEIFRIDHYLGKETVQNLMVMRFANSIFEPIWNYKYIDHVQITVSESLGVGSRGGYYDPSGATRDMVQNHLFQLLALTAMEPPAALDATSIRDEKVKVFKSIRPVSASKLQGFAVRGQYGTGEANGQKTNGYTKEKGVPPDSKTETFAAFKFFIDNWRWSGTPFYLRTGKFLTEKLSEIVVRFRSPPQTLFQKQCETPVYPNDLIVRVQPEEGISWRLNGKVPGGSMNIKSVALDMAYKTTFKTEAPEAYERLIHDAIAGEATLFIRADEAEAAWAVIDPIEQGWAADKNPPEQYAPGTWGPQKAMDLIEQDGRRWVHSGDEEPPIIACAV